MLRENVRQAVELLLEDVSAANRTNASLFNPLVQHANSPPLTDAQAHEALYQATVRLVMRLVVCLFAESRQLLPVNDPIFARAYGVRSLYEVLEEAVRTEGGVHVLFNRQTAWPRLMALFRLIHGGSAHGSFPLRAYGGALLRPGDATSSDAVARAIHILEHAVSVGDATIHSVLRKLLRGPLPVMRGRQKTFVEGPVDYTDLRTEFIGLIYEGLLDYRLKRTDQEIGPQVFLNLGREPVLPLKRLEDMLAHDRNGLKNLLTTLRKEKVTATVASDEEEAEDEDAEEAGDDQEEATEEPTLEVEAEAAEDGGPRGGDYLDAVESAKRWAKEAVILAGLVAKQGKKETDAEYQKRTEGDANKLIKRVVATGEFYLVRAGNTRKGTGTFYTRPQLAVPTVHRTLEPLCYDKTADGTLTPKEPETILGLKVCDPACGSASFLVAALHYLTDALYKSLCHHRHLDDPEQAKKLTLPYGRLRTGKTKEELVPFPPNDPQRGDTFPERIKALLRRHVVERCIYGVDINPLAVELARVSLWVETLDPELPFSFLDHKIKVGNSLVGCWLDRVEDYPLKAWEREGGDGKDGERTGRIETFLKGEKVGNRRSGDGIIKKEMRQVIESRFSKQAPLFPDMKVTTESVVTQARAEYERLHDLPVADPDERERYFREHIENSPTLRTLKEAMNEWCAIWFWPTDEESLNHVPTPLTFHKRAHKKDALVERVASQLRFFHWELEFPDVFTPERSGFDCMLGNPPWEVMKPNSHEFFSVHDPAYRSYDKQTAENTRQPQLLAEVPFLADEWDEYRARFKSLGNGVKHLAEPFDLSLVRGNRNDELHGIWKRARSKRSGLANSDVPYLYQGSADLNSYKLFLEVVYHLLTTSGRLGLIVPSGLYSDSGSKDLRELFLDHAEWEWLFSFENKKKIFAIHSSFKFAPTIVALRQSMATEQRPSLKVAFMVHDLAAWERPDPPTLDFDRSLIPLFSPRSKSLPEVRTHRDLEICRKIYDKSFRIGDKAPGWEISYACEFHMTNDSKHFKPREWWEARGYRADVFGRWVGPDGDVALPLYEGRMIGQFDFSQKGYVRGRGRSAVWREIQFDAKAVEPQFLMAIDTFLETEGVNMSFKLGFMDVTSATNSRTFISSVISGVPCGNKVPTLSISDCGPLKCLFLAGCGNSFAFDYTARNRLSGITLNWFIVEELPMPDRCEATTRFQRVSLASALLTFIHRRFAPEWLRLKNLCPELASKGWKQWWAVTEADRLRLRAEIDALCADLYGLDPDDFDWIVRDDPNDPKGFWRVDKQLPFRERLTGLAAAFRALKKGKWTAETAASLSNDEFFDLLGIPELTNSQAAHAKGLPGPLIEKRDGCHVWKPEDFPKNDPRHGWTWDDCWKDAVALLGSEDAVRVYIHSDMTALEEWSQERGSKSQPSIRKRRGSHQGELF